MDSPSTSFAIKNGHAGRRFRILLCRHGTWLQGKVVHVKHYPNRTTESKYDLVATIDPCATLENGAMVLHKHWLPGEPFLVHQVAAPDPKVATGGGVDLIMSDGRILSNQAKKDLRLTGGRFEFVVAHMNDQGGATLQCSQPIVGIANTILSLEWLDRIPEKFINLDVNLAPPPLPNTPANLARQRSNALSSLGREMSQQRRKSVSLDAVGQRLYHTTVCQYIRDPTQMREFLLSLPFVLYPALLVPCLDTLTAADKGIVRAWLHFALEAFNDRAWTNECKGLALRCTDKGASDSDEEFRMQMFGAMYKLLKSLGKWFTKMGEYRAAVWCYEKNLALSAAYCMDDCLANCLDYLAQTHHHYGNVLPAFCCLEQSMAMKRTEYRFKLAQQLRAAAQCQIGTTGRLTPFTPRKTLTAQDGTVWEQSETTSLEKGCAFCGKGKVSSVCSCCHLVVYCNHQCQKAHWLRVHKRTCLFLKRG